MNDKQTKMWGCRLSDWASPFRDRSMVFSQSHTGEISYGERTQLLFEIYLLFVLLFLQTNINAILILPSSINWLTFIDFVTL